MTSNWRVRASGLGLRLCATATPAPWPMVTGPGPAHSESARLSHRRPRLAKTGDESTQRPSEDPTQLDPISEGSRHWQIDPISEGPRQLNPISKRQRQLDPISEGLWPSLALGPLIGSGCLGPSLILSS